jgi:hypothetical protein
MPPRKPAEPAAEPTAPKPAKLKKLPPLPRGQRKKKSTGDRPAKPTVDLDLPKIAGRPPIYDQPYHDDAAFRMALFGHTNYDLAKYFGVSEMTVETWIVGHPSFAVALRAGREEADSEIVASLYRKAKGYERPAEKIFYDAKNHEVVRVPYTEYYPPDSTAQIYWLKNRQRANWKEKWEEPLKEPSDKDKEVRSLAQRLRDMTLEIEEKTCVDPDE